MLDIRDLKRRRLQLDLTQTQLAKRAGVSQSLITKIEAGKLDPKLSSVERIEAALQGLERHDERTIADILHRGVINATPNERVPHLIRRMREHGISQVPVLEGNHVAGLVTETSILEAIGAGKDIARLTAGDVMADAPPVLPSTTPIAAVWQLLEHIPLVIVRDRSRILGVVTRADLLGAQL